MKPFAVMTTVAGYPTVLSTYWRKKSARKESARLASQTVIVDQKFWVEKRSWRRRIFG